MAYFSSHRQVAKLQDGRLIAKGRMCYITAQGGWVAINVRVPDLRYIEEVLHIQVSMLPAIDAILTGPFNKAIWGNVVGMTFYSVVTDNTLCVEVIAIGPP